MWPSNSIASDIPKVIENVPSKKLEMIDCGMKTIQNSTNWSVNKQNIGSSYNRIITLDLKKGNSNMCYNMDALGVHALWKKPDIEDNPVYDFINIMYPK